MSILNLINYVSIFKYKTKKKVNSKFLNNIIDVEKGKYKCSLHALSIDRIILVSN